MKRYMKRNMKGYVKPVTRVLHINTENHLLTGTGGVQTGSEVNEEYSEEDVSFSRGASLWEEE